MECHFAGVILKVPELWFRKELTLLISLEVVIWSDLTAMVISLKYHGDRCLKRKKY